jgi:hypothetical protein
MTITAAGMSLSISKSFLMNISSMAGLISHALQGAAAATNMEQTIPKKSRRRFSLTSLNNRRCRFLMYGVGKRITDGSTGHDISCRLPLPFTVPFPSRTITTGPISTTKV